MLISGERGVSPSIMQEQAGVLKWTPIDHFLPVQDCLATIEDTCRFYCTHTFEHCVCSFNTFSYISVLIPNRWCCVKIKLILNVICDMAALLCWTRILH